VAVILVVPDLEKCDQRAMAGCRGGTQLRCVPPSGYIRSRRGRGHSARL